MIFVALWGTLVALAQASPVRIDKPRISHLSLVSEAGDEKQPIIDRVDFLGFSQLRPAYLERLLEIGPKEIYDPQRVQATLDNLRTAYATRGYRHAGLRAHLRVERSAHPENVLEFTAEENQASRIVSLVVEPPSAQSAARQRLWRRLQKRFQKRLAPLVGENYYHERLLERVRSFQVEMVADGYIGTKIDSLEIVDLSDQTLEVRLVLQLGDLVEFGFRGNTQLRRAQLDRIVTEQSTVGLGRDYLNAIEEKIREEYRGLGYPDVDIEVFTVESAETAKRRIIYRIEEGPRVQIRSVEFDGNAAFQAENLEEELYRRAAGLVQRRIFVDREIKKAAELLVEMMKERGYLSARLVAVQANRLPVPRMDPNHAEVDLVIYLIEGEQTHLERLEVEGLEAFKLDEVRQILGQTDQAPLNLFALTAGLESLKKAYRDCGYLDIKILNEGQDDLVRYGPQNRTAEIVLELEEGPQYTVGAVSFEGLQITQEEVAQRELTLHPGEILSEAQVEESTRRLKRLGIFSTVNMLPADPPEGAAAHVKNLRVSLQESERGTLLFGPGVRNDLGLRAFSQFKYANLWGKNHSASVTANVNRRFGSGYNAYHFIEGQMVVGYNWPYFGMPGLSFRPSLNLGRTQYPIFSARTFSLSILWDKKILPDPNLTASFSYALEDIYQFNAVSAAENQHLRIGSVTGKLILDLRDNSQAPSKGFYSTLTLDFAHPHLGSQGSYPIAYYRAQWRADQYFPLPYGLIFFTSFRTGFEASLPLVAQDPTFRSLGISSIPLIKQFMLGGIGSLRGYQESQLNQSTALIHRSLGYVNYRNQLEFPIAPSFRVAGFVDAANLLVDAFSFGKLLYGAGAGVHYETPAGSINLDLGFKLNKPPGMGYPYVVHFSVGVI